MRDEERVSGNTRQFPDETLSRLSADYRQKVRVYFKGASVAAAKRDIIHYIRVMLGSIYMISLPSSGAFHKARVAQSARRSA